MSTQYDAIIIGAGQAGPPLAARLSAAGQRIAVIERKLFGGTCVNTGCMPTKTLVASARVAHQVRRAADFGVHISDPLGVDMVTVKARKDAVSTRAREGVESSLRALANCTVIQGHARFTGPHEIEVNGAHLAAARIFINAGARALVPNLPGLSGIPILTNTSILELDTLPRHLAIIGGSYIGLEFAQMYRRFGSQVTVIEKGPRLVAHEDRETSDTIRDILAREGVAIHLGAADIAFARQGAGISVILPNVATIDASHVLMAVGRRPNTDDLGLENAGIRLDEKGYIAVDDTLQTNVPGVFALGDCNGRGAFTHTSYNDYEIVAANLLDGQHRRVSDRIKGYALYIDPPLGRAGLSETEARNAGHRIRVGTRPMTRVGRAVEKDETQGFMKIVVDADSNAILGAAILGIGGDEAIHGILDMMNAGAPYPTLQWAVPIHPTVSELIPTVIGSLELKP